MITPGIDHIALTVPNLDEQVDRLTSAFGMVVESRSERFARVTVTVESLVTEDTFGISVGDFILQDNYGLVTTATSIPTAAQAEADEEIIEEADLASGETADLTLTFQVDANAGPQSVFTVPTTTASSTSPKSAELHEQWRRSRCPSDLRERAGNVEAPTPPRDSAFDGAEGEAGDEAIEEQRDGECDRCGDDHRGRLKRLPEEHVSAHQLGRHAGADALLRAW